MIYHVAEIDNDFTLRSFVRNWARDLVRHVQTIQVHQLAMATRMPVGTYIFSDIERETPLQLELQAQVFEQLAAYGPPMRVLNHPTKVLRRLALLNE